MINYGKFPQNNMTICLRSYNYNYFILIHRVTSIVYYYLIRLYYYYVPIYLVVYTRYMDYGSTSIDNRPRQYVDTCNQVISHSSLDNSSIQD